MKVIATLGDRKFVVEGTDKADIDRQLIGISKTFRDAQQSAEENPIGAFGSMAARSVADNLLNLFPALGDMSAGAAALGRTAAGQAGDLISGQDNFDAGFTAIGRRFDEERQQFPASALRAMPSPSVAQIEGTVRGAASSVGNMASLEAPNFAKERREAIQNEEAQIYGERAGAPFSTGSGAVAGDILTMVLGRAPAGRRISQAQRNLRLREIEKGQARLLEEIPEDVRTRITDSVSRKFGDAIEESSTSLPRAFRKSGEAALEGFMLAALQDGDPVSTAAWATAGQAAGSMGLWAFEKAVAHPLLATVGTAFLAYNLYQSAKFTEQDIGDLIEGAEFGFDKATMVISAGALAGLAGAGRLRNKQVENIPRVMDAITTAPRGTVISLVEEMTNTNEENQQRVLRTMDQMFTDPRVFNKDQMRSLDRAMKNGTFVKEVNRLFEESESFRGIMGESQ